MFRPDGQPMVFYIPPGDTRKALTDLIEDNGGVVHKKWNKGDIVLISESDGGAQKTLPKGIEAYKVDFIDQSLRAKELQDLESYRIHTNRTPTSTGRGRAVYTIAEDKIIVDYVARHPNLKTTGVQIWKRMENENLLPSHTWQSIKDHYLKRILPGLRVNSVLTQKTPKLSDDQNQSVAPPIKFVVPGKKTANSSKKKKGQADEEPEEEEEAEEEIEVAEENEEEEEVEEEKDGGEEEDVEEEEESQQGTDDAITRTPPSTIKKGLDAERWSRNRKNKRRKSSRVLFPSDDSQSQHEEQGPAKKRRLDAASKKRGGKSVEEDGAGGKSAKGKKKKEVVQTKGLVKRRKSTRPPRQSDEELEEQEEEQEREAEAEVEEEGEEEEIEKRRRLVRNLARECSKTKEEVFSVLYSFSGVLDAARDYLVYNSDKLRPWTPREDKALLSHNSDDMRRVIADRGMAAVTERLHFLNN